MNSKTATWFAIGTIFVVLFAFDGDHPLFRSSDVTNGATINVQAPHHQPATPIESRYVEGTFDEEEEQYPEANAPRIE